MQLKHHDIRNRSMTAIFLIFSSFLLFMYNNITGKEVAKLCSKVEKEEWIGEDTKTRPSVEG